MSDELRDRYLSLFGLEPTEVGELSIIEGVLGIKFPNDFTEVSEFYSGGMLGGISHNAISSRGPATNITEETIRLRDAVGLLHSFVVLAEPPGSVIVMNTANANGSPKVVWCDAGDVSRVGSPQGMHRPQLWDSYAEFFSFLLDNEEQERADGE